MIIFLLALIGTLVVMVVLTVGRLWFGRRETVDKRKFLGWFLRYFVFNYLFSLLILSLSTSLDGSILGLAMGALATADK